MALIHISAVLYTLMLTKEGRLQILLTYHFAAKGPKPPHQSNSQEQQQHQDSDEGCNPTRLEEAENKSKAVSKVDSQIPNMHFLRKHQKKTIGSIIMLNPTANIFLYIL